MDGVGSAAFRPLLVHTMIWQNATETIQDSVCVCVCVCVCVHLCVHRALSHHLVEGSSARGKVSRDHLSEVGVLAFLPCQHR